jgi:hypothetical protein
MAVSDAEKTFKHILLAVERQILCLTKEKKTGKFCISVEFNISQGSVGDVYVESNSREKILK